MVPLKFSFFILLIQVCIESLIAQQFTCVDPSSTPPWIQLKKDVPAKSGKSPIECGVHSLQNQDSMFVFNGKVLIQNFVPTRF